MNTEKLNKMSNEFVDSDRALLNRLESDADMVRYAINCAKMSERVDKRMEYIYKTREECETLLRKIHEYFPFLRRTDGQATVPGVREAVEAVKEGAQKEGSADVVSQPAGSDQGQLVAEPVRDDSFGV